MRNEHQLPFELWGGPEFTLNRVHDTYFDQLRWSGHDQRPGDLDLFAQLGLRALRYPVLWERVAPDSPQALDWSWTDARLERIRALGMQAIAGLVHHGSGPRYTSLVADDFAEGLAQFAGQVARRYPWLEYYIPVNEPLTTARFSGLYGHWYPHAQDGRAFGRALMNQCRAVVLAMRAIRQVNPAAKLVGTEDLGKTFSTSALHYQAEYERERRWLSYDLLCGRIDRTHAMWDYLRDCGIAESELLWFRDHPCVPDIMGFNYYLTSERFLDPRVALYPNLEPGFNGIEAFVDVAAVRVLEGGLQGPSVLLQEAWARYKVPVAITEIHNGSTREEQLRWLVDVIEAARDAHASGVDVRAVTAWALLGSYNWNTLATRDASYYERGVFDVRSPDQPRPTILAQVLQDLSSGRAFDHPVLDAQGWWRRPDRAIYGVVTRDNTEALLPVDETPSVTVAQPRPVVITGAGGTLGRAFMLLCELRGLPYLPLTRPDLDITSERDVQRVLGQHRPWAVINAAGYVRVDDAELDPQACHRINMAGAVTLARGCADQGIPFVSFSSDLVFDGAKGRDYVESDAVNPLNVYGESKAQAEAGVFAVLPDALMIRTSAFFGPWDAHNFVTAALRTLEAGQPFMAAEDTVISPTYILELVHQTIDLLIDGQKGIWHLSNPGAICWADLARRAAQRAGLDANAVIGCPMRELGLRAARPSYSALTSERGILLTPLDNALDLYFAYRSGGDRFLLSWESLAAKMRFSVARRDLLGEFAAAADALAPSPA